MFKAPMHWVGRAFAVCLLATSAVAASAAGYVARGGKMYDAGGQQVQLRGISHFGFNATILQPQYLWAMGWKEQIAQIKSLGFNAIRVPFVPDTLYNTTPVDKLSYIDPARNPELLGKTPLQVLDLWMAEADRQGLYLMLDFHSVTMQRLYPQWFVSDPAEFGLIHNKQAYTKEHWMRDLALVAKRYAHLPHFFAIDLYNEPNGTVRWSTGDANMANPAYFWKEAAEKGAAAVLAANPNLLIFVQGINGNFDGRERADIPMNWGEDFQPQVYQPLAIPLDKLVLSPHTYGPDVFVKSSFSAANFPANLPAHWEALFGQFNATHPVVPGEWGGRLGNGTGGAADTVWQNAFVDYMIAKGMSSSFYWCYTPNSGDTGGVLDDQLNVLPEKMALLKRLWAASGTAPAPTPAPQPAPAPAPAPKPAPAPAPAPAPTPAPGASYLQPGIMAFAPTSGPVGTLVTITGTNFTGLNQAWVGKAHGVPVSVVSAKQVKVRIPAGASTGAIGIFNPKYVAFTASSFTVTGSTAAPAPKPTPPPAPAPAPAPVYAQPGIMTFSPSAGPVGTLVTITGTNFTGLNQAWVGKAHGVPVSVVSAKQVKVRIPAGATSGAIGIFNPKYAAFTASAFTVTGSAAAPAPKPAPAPTPAPAPAPVYAQPGITSFSPSAGPVGTLVTINGSGFTGLNQAWVGKVHGVPVTVVNAKQVKVRIPAGATSGSIGIFNPKHAAFTATAFTVR